MGQGAVTKGRKQGDPVQSLPGNCGGERYRSGKIRSWLRRKGIRYAMLRKRNKRGNGPFVRGL